MKQLRLIIASIWIVRLFRSSRINRITGLAALILISGLFVIFSIGGIYQNQGILSVQKDFSLIKCNPTCMEISNPDNGIKAAAWWIRKNSEETDVIMPYAIGGIGLESSVLDYYLKRNHISNEDPTLYSATYLIDNYQHLTDYILIDANFHNSIVDRIDDNFTKKALIKENDRSILYIYGKKSDKQYEIIDSNEANHNFDIEFGNFDGIVR